MTYDHWKAREPDYGIPCEACQGRLWIWELDHKVPCWLCDKAGREPAKVTPRKHVEGAKS